MAANQPQSELLTWKIPIVWDPVPDWWLFERIDQRLAMEVVNIRLEVQQQMLEAQVKGIERAREVLQQGLEG